MQIYLAVTPDKLSHAARFTDRLAHVAYRIGPDGRLNRRELLMRTRGGLMVLGDQDCGAIHDIQALCRDVWRECGNRGFSGVVADFEQSPAPDRVTFLDSMGRILARNGRQLFVPEAYGDRVPQAVILICTALSGGNLRVRLEEAAEQFGRQRLALDLERLRMDFPLPCPGGEGTPMTGEALDALLRTRQPNTFYSADLCAKYFTYTQEGSTHFVLFDDAGSLRRKLQLGQELGFSMGFLMYPEVAELLPELFSPQQGRQNMRK